MNTNVTDTSATDVDAGDSTGAAVETVEASRKRPGRPVDPNSGLSLARAVFDASLSRKDNIAAFQNVTLADGSNIKKGTAAAYYSVIKRDLAEAASS